MKIPHSIEGLILAPIFASLIFVLKLSCPARTGEGCFADTFNGLLFLPLPFIYKIFAFNPSFVGRHEVLLLLGYWGVVGFFIGLLADVHKKETH